MSREKSACEDKATCCTSDRVPKLEKAPAGKGKLVQVDDSLKVYVVGDPESKNVMIVHPDILGSTSGRHCSICDFFADNGYYVLMIDYFQKPYTFDVDFKAYMKDYPIHKIQGKLDIAYKMFVHPKIIDKLVMIGFCLGSWVLAHENLRNPSLLGDKLSGGVHYHPSFGLEYLFSDNPACVDEIVKRMTVPMVLVPTKGDVPQAQKGSYLEGDEYQVEIWDYSHQKHGFVSQGDMDTDEQIKKDILELMDKTLTFFSKL